MLSNFSNELKRILKMSTKEKNLLKHTYVGTEHFILAILKSKNNIRYLLNDYEINYYNFKQALLDKVGIGNEEDSLFVLTPLFKKILEDAILCSKDMNNTYVDLSFVVKLIIEEGEGIAYRILCEMGVDIDKIYESITSEAKVCMASILNDIGYDLTKKAKDNLIDPIIGRDKEIERVIEILLRKNKKNALLIGPAGVGKTAIAEGLAKKIVNKDVPSKLLNKKIISISIASLVAGTKYRGEFEEKLINIINELERNKDYILFIDEIHTIMGAGGAEGAIDASNILKPALSRDNITVIGATKEDEYRNYIEKDKAFSRRFQTVLINEPSSKELYLILKNVKGIYEKYHNVLIDDKTIKYIINISKRININRKEPDRSLDFLDEISSMVISKEELNEHNNRLQNKLNKIKDIKNLMISNGNYFEALKERQKERKIESQINNRLIKKDKIEKRFITKEDINEYISSKYNIMINDSKEIKSVIEKQKRRHKYILDLYNKEFDEVMKTTEKLYSYKKLKPVSILFDGKDSDIKEKIANILSESFFNYKKIVIDLNEYEEQLRYNLEERASYEHSMIKYFNSLKENPFYLIMFINYNRASIKTRMLIKDIITKGYINKISFINSLIIISTDNINRNPIGFNNKIIINDDLSKYVTKKISFNKTKIFML